MRFACEWCERLKDPDEAWILGFAAENLGATAARREVTVMSGWDRERAVHPFAVHFCSIEHKDNYMAALFDTTPTPVVGEGKVRRSVPKEKTVITRTVKKQSSRRRAS